MRNYDDFKKKAKVAIDSFADASVDAYKAAEEKTRILARKTKLRAGIVNDKATIRRLSVELGASYYKKYIDDENSEFSQLCKEISCAYEKIAEKEGEIAVLKASSGIKAYETTKKEECCDNKEECCDNSDDNAPKSE